MPKILFLIPFLQAAEFRMTCPESRSLKKQIQFYTVAFGIEPEDGPVKHMNTQPNNPLHGKTLEAIVTELVAYYGWEQLGRKIRINCFVNNPGIKSSLTFLRKTEWARKQVEELYLTMKNRGGS